MPPSEDHMVSTKGKKEPNTSGTMFEPGLKGNGTGGAHKDRRFEQSELCVEVDGVREASNCQVIRSKPVANYDEARLGGGA